MLHIVKYASLERGWGGEITFDGFKTKEQANDEVVKVSNKIHDTGCDSPYIFAWYVGTMESIPDKLYL